MQEEEQRRSDRAKAIIERIERERGYVREWPRLLAERDPEAMEHLYNFSTHVLFRRTSLPIKFKELILICLNAFDYYEFGFRVHVRSALKAGVTEDEILEAIEVVGIQKLHSLTLMLPILVEEVANFKAGGAPGRRDPGANQD